MAAANIINHVAFVLDASLSMNGVAGQLIKVVDSQIEHLARRSKELDQETRITVYTFNTPANGDRTPVIQCLIYDKDVLRVPSIAGLYRTGGMTPLVDASLLALNDLALTPEKYGEHSFLIYVLTDGEENSSRDQPEVLLRKIQGLPDHWTVATFVPNPLAVHEAKRFGFPAQNIAVWDATTAAGVAEAGEKIRQTTENFMVSRSQGIRGSRNLFAMDTPSLDTVSRNLDALHFGQFRLLDITTEGRIDEFVERKTGRAYRRGEAYYQLSKPEKVQPQKDIAILGKKGVYVGRDARRLLNLPDHEVRVSPDHNADYDIFVQSTSNNRKLVPNTKLLLLS
ncbi:hypothetical protein FHT44_005198 [Mycolicibacterium sp. BK634]|uniref:vWA domain-containing protein n=1 Tax=Mycolicibacterium sp. BK634 TaxID=2587099 RepID=UPI001613E141|nr:vWA domain-containing protein [Mycolicibacterium sp. BK634]MBB3752686.1 hypothetical protein [Mycolicibacterium sp. BK634]